LCCDSKLFKQQPFVATFKQLRHSRAGGNPETPSDIQQAHINEVLNHTEGTPDLIRHFRLFFRKL
jgi:hypothetical protein